MDRQLYRNVLEGAQGDCAMACLLNEGFSAQIKAVAEQATIDLNCIIYEWSKGNMDLVVTTSGIWDWNCFQASYVDMYSGNRWFNGAVDCINEGWHSIIGHEGECCPQLIDTEYMRCELVRTTGCVGSTRSVLRPDQAPVTDCNDGSLDRWDEPMEASGWISDSGSYEKGTKFNPKPSDFSAASSVIASSVNNLIVVASVLHVLRSCFLLGA